MSDYIKWNTSKLRAELEKREFTPPPTKKEMMEMLQSDDQQKDLPRPKAAMVEKCVMEKVEDILTCSMCLEVLEDPKTLNCLHSYCRGCIEQIKPPSHDDGEPLKPATQDGEEQCKAATPDGEEQSKAATPDGEEQSKAAKQNGDAALKSSQQNGVDGYECPQCRRFTPKTEVRVVHLIIQLLDAYHAANKASEDSSCDRCKTETATWRCFVCKKYANLCDVCKANHDEFAAEHHVLSIDELIHSRPVIDKPLHCDEHTDNKLEVFCIQCQKTICVLCKIFHHNDHSAEPISDALKRLLPQCEASKQQIEENIKANKEEIETIETEKQETIEKYKIAREKLDAEEKQELSKHQSDIQDVEDRITQQKQVLTWMRTTLDRAKGVTLLKELQDGLFDKFDEIASEGSACGKFGTDVTMHASRCLPWKIRSDAAVRQDGFQLPNQSDQYPYTRIAILWDKLWLFNHHTNQAGRYDFQATHIDTVLLDGKIQTPRTAIQVNAKDAIVAAKSGLYSIDESGKITDTFSCEGDFSDLCLAEGRKLYALKHIANVVVVFSKQRRSWKKDSEIPLSEAATCSGNTYVNTMIVHNKLIYIAMIEQNRIVVYDVAGKMIKIYKGFSLPSICGLDKDNTLLVANYGTSYVMSQSYDGGATNLFAGHSYPWYGVFENEKTFWIVNGDNHLSKHTYQ